MPGPPTGPAQGSEPLGLKIRNHPNRITRRERLLQRSYRSQLENGPIRWARTSESNPLYTSVDASRPHAASADNAGRKLVEPPGIAPGSGPLITSAFIAIVRPKPDKPNIGLVRTHSKRRLFGLRFSPSDPAPSGRLIAEPGQLPFGVVSCRLFESIDGLTTRELTLDESGQFTHTDRLHGGKRGR